VEFCGQAPNSAVCDAMRQADVVLVPSRHSYAEGLPLTIYEALRARTPIVASDHPMFAGILVDDASAKVFRAGDVQALAAALRSLMADRDLYECLSRNAQDCWEQIQIGHQVGGTHPPVARVCRGEIWLARATGTRNGCRTAREFLRSAPPWAANRLTEAINRTTLASWHPQVPVAQVKAVRAFNPLLHAAHRRAQALPGHGLHADEVRVLYELAHRRRSTARDWCAIWSWTPAT
jgi:hypothetical protein